MVARYKVPVFNYDLFKIRCSRVESGDERDNFPGSFRFVLISSAKLMG